MKFMHIKICIILLGIAINVRAQHSITSSGLDASGTGGSVAYSIGQFAYITNTNLLGSEAQGVQQPYEIHNILSVDDNFLALDLSVFPNPTTHSLTLCIPNVNTSTLNFELVDMNGKVIESRNISRNIERIDMENLPSACFMLKIISHTKVLKAFQIIKN